MAVVSTVSAAMANAITGVTSSVGESSLRRLVAGADASAHNIIDGIVLPAARNLTQARGYMYRNNGPPGTVPMLTSQQLQVTKSSSDTRVMGIQRDAVNLMSRAVQYSDAIKRDHPSFSDEGAVHLRLTMPAPNNTSVRGFRRKSVKSEDLMDPPSPGMSDTGSDEESCAAAPPSSISSQASDEDSNCTKHVILKEDKSWISPRGCPAAPAPLCRTKTIDPNRAILARDAGGGEPGQMPGSSDHNPVLKERLERRVREVYNKERTEHVVDTDSDDFDLWYDSEDSEDQARKQSDLRERAERRRVLEEQRSKPPDQPPVPLAALGAALEAREVLFNTYGIQMPQTVESECDFCNWLGFGRARGFLDSCLHMANPAGAMDLYVLDVMLPTEVLTACMETADMLLAEMKPVKNLHLQKALRRLKRYTNKKVDQATYNYLVTIVHLVTMAILLDLGDSGKNHCFILGYDGKQPIFSDFFANTNLEATMDDVKAAKVEAGHPVSGIVLAAPAPQIKGSLNETIVLYETAAFQEYELKEKKMVVGAVQVGVDLLGKPPPNDHTNPLSYVSAIYRHLGDAEVTICPDTDYEYVTHLDRSKEAVMTPEHRRVFEDYIDDHCAKFDAFLEDERFDFEFWADGKPSSYPEDKYDTWLGEQIQDENFFSSDTGLNVLLRETIAADDDLAKLLSTAEETKAHMQKLTATAACKKYEDSARARFVITPGRAGSEGLHQARCAPAVKAFEAFHAFHFNHTNLKGLTEETRRIRFAEYLRAVPKGAVVFGTDKKSNDSCFSESVWKMCVKYLARMSSRFEKHTMAKPYVYTGTEAENEVAFPEGVLDMKYWVLKMTPLLAILLSGIGPTSFFNRIESAVENGATVLRVFGEGAYQKWRVAEGSAQESNHPSWLNYPPPHSIDIVDWRPLAPHMVSDTSVKYDKLAEDQIDTYHMGIYEGDDQAHAIIPPDKDDWRSLTPTNVVMKYTAELSKATNFMFEAAPTADDLDMVGRNSVVEMLSTWIGLPSGNADDYEVAVCVPKILKALRKLPHAAVSSQHTPIYDKDTGEVVDVEHDVAYYVIALTRFYAITIIQKESLGVRGLCLTMGDYHYSNLERLVGKMRASSTATMYGDRDPESRGLEEAASTTYAFCGALREAAHEAVENVRRSRVTRVCVVAWRAELPELAKYPKDAIAAALLRFDDITLGLEITDQHIADPMMLWEEFDIGILLGPLCGYATSNHRAVAALYRSAKMLADSGETCELARELAGPQRKGSTKKDGGPDSYACKPTGGKGKGKSKGKGEGLAKGGKGKSTPKGNPKGGKLQPSAFDARQVSAKGPAKGRW